LVELNERDPMMDTLKLSKGLEAAGFSREAAELTSTAIAVSLDGHAASKADLEKTETALRSDLEKTETALRSDLEKTETALRMEIQDVRTEVQATESSLRTEIQDLRTEIRGVDGSLRTAIAELEARMNWRMVALAGVIIAAIKLLPNP
jgi:chromosome segregation ATPase